MKRIFHRAFCAKIHNHLIFSSFQNQPACVFSIGNGYNFENKAVTLHPKKTS